MILECPNHGVSLVELGKNLVGITAVEEKDLTCMVWRLSCSPVHGRKDESVRGNSFSQGGKCVENFPRLHVLFRSGNFLEPVAGNVKTKVDPRPGALVT